MRIERTSTHDIYFFSKEELKKLRTSGEAANIMSGGVLENTGDEGGKVTLFKDVAGGLLSKRVESLAKKLDFEFTGDAPLQQN